MTAAFDDFMKLDIRVGEITACAPLVGAKKSAYQLQIDFGEEIGIKNSSAQITELYEPEQLIGRQILAVVNFPPKRIAGFVSQVLVLGVYAKDGVVLIGPSQTVQKGDRLG